MGRPQKIVTRRRSIAQQAALRLAFSLGLLMLLVGLTTALIYRIALNKAADERIENLTTFLSVRLSELERDWELNTRDLRVRIEHTRILEQANNFTPQLQAYLTIQGGGRRYSHLIVQDKNRQTLFAFGRNYANLAKALNGKEPGNWLLDQASGELYRVFTEQIWLGDKGTGTILALFPINNALLFQLTMPGVLLTSLHHGQKIASSEGQIGLDMPQVPQAAGVKLETREIPWGYMDNNPTTLMAQTPVKGLFSPLELSLGVSAVPLLDGLILWFTLGIWLMANARRIKTLGVAVQEFSDQQAVTPRLKEQIASAKQGKRDEIDEVASAVESMAVSTVKHEQEIQRYRENLEVLVRERTRDLEAAQQTLIRAERLAALGQLTATVSHELRNPLASMRPSLQVIKRKLPDAEDKARQAIDRIERNITRCDQIIEEMLDFTRIRDLTLAPVALDSWLAETLADQKAPEGIRIVREFGLGDLQVNLDPDRLRRAVINVFDNACHAMEERRMQETGNYQPQLTVSTQRGDEGRVEIEFVDNGPGMPEEVLAHIFEPLFSTKGFGVGLGMPTVKQIMEQHGGGIAVRSQTGQGTQVILWLPDITATPRPGTLQEEGE